MHNESEKSEVFNGWELHRNWGKHIWNIITVIISKPTTIDEKVE